MLLLVVLAGVCSVAASPAAEPLDISAAGCGTPPSPVLAGQVAMDITNHAKAFAAVYLINPAGDVYAEIPSVPPGRTLPLATTLTGGTYAVRCVFTDGVIRTSPAFTVTGTAQDAVTGYRPLPDLDLTAPVQAYRAWIGAALPGLATACQVLDADVARGDLAAARTDWLTAHLAYERLGAAYNSFGDFDDEIDSRSGPGWTGFHAIESELWHGGTPDHIHALTTDLVRTVDALQQDFPSEEIDPGDLSLRAHEILENSMQFQLTGIADYGSHTTLATVGANLEGTREVVSVLTPLIAPRDPGLLPVLAAGMDRVRVDLSTGGPRLDGDLGQLLEELSVLPNLLAARTSG